MKILKKIKIKILINTNKCNSYEHTGDFMANNFQDTWDKPLLLIQSGPNISKDEMENIIHNYRYLASFLGKNWLLDENNKNHPIRGWFGNSIGVLKLSELGLALQLLENESQFPNLRSRLLSTTGGFNGAYYELITGYYLVKHKYNFNLLRNYKKNKSSDILLQGSEREFFIEITHKEYPDEFNLYFNNSFKILDYLASNSDGLLYNFDILKPLSTPSTEQIITNCKKVIENAKINGFEEYHEPNLIDVYIFKSEYAERVPIEKRKMQLKFPELNEIPRIKGTIKEKQSQLDPNKPGVIIIYDDICFCQPNIESFNDNLISELDQVVYEYPEISAVIIISTEHPAFDEDDNYSKNTPEFIIWNLRESSMIRRRNILTIFNKFARFLLTDQEKEMLSTLFL